MAKKIIIDDTSAMSLVGAILRQAARDVQSKEEQVAGDAKAFWKSEWAETLCMGLKPESILEDLVAIGPQNITPYQAVI